MTMQDAIFYLFGATAIAASFGVTVSRNPLNGAVCLLLSLFAVAGLFAWAGAHFLAAMQVLVYAGAVAVLFVFVIMLLNLSDRELGGVENGRSQLFGLVFVLVALVAISAVAMTAPAAFPRVNGDPGAVKNIGAALLTRYVVPFEVISLLLLASMSGAVMLTKRSHGLEDAIATINRVRLQIERRSHGAFVADPLLPFQFGPPRNQEPPPANSPEVGMKRGTLDPGDTV